NNNSLGPVQRQLVLLGAPSAATGSSARGSRARLHPQQCALDSIRARCAAQRRPAPRTGSAERLRATRSPLLLLLLLLLRTLRAGMPCCPQAQAEASIRTDVVHQTGVCWSSQSEVNLVSQHNKREVLGIPGAGLDEKLVSPAVEGFESVGGSHIKHQNTAICTSVEGHTKRLEPFLTGCVPDLQDTNTKHLVLRRCL
ncbi:mCG1036659, partial [Mus musculus]